LGGKVGGKKHSREHEGEPSGLGLRSRAPPSILSPAEWQGKKKRKKGGGRSTGFALDPHPGSRDGRTWQARKKKGNREAIEIAVAACLRARRRPLPQREGKEGKGRGRDLAGPFLVHTDSLAHLTGLRRSRYDEKEKRRKKEQAEVEDRPARSASGFFLHREIILTSRKEEREGKRRGRGEGINHHAGGRLLAVLRMSFGDREGGEEKKKEGGKGERTDVAQTRCFH